jgi:ribosomal protein S18 acetylase RimI-like enzyme
MGGARAAEARDLEAVAALWQALVELHGRLDFRLASAPRAAAEWQRVAARQLADPQAALLVWEEAGALLGFCAARVVQAPPGLAEHARCEIDELFVPSAARRRGIGRALVEAALGWGAARGAGQVLVRVAARNAEGQAFWRALGFGDFVDVLARRL